MGKTENTLHVFAGYYQYYVNRFAQQEILMGKLIGLAL